MSIFGGHRDAREQLLAGLNDHKKPNTSLPPAASTACVLGYKIEHQRQRLLHDFERVGPFEGGNAVLDLRRDQSRGKVFVHGAVKSSVSGNQ